jgi:hypothetical protein
MVCIIFCTDKEQYRCLVILNLTIFKLLHASVLQAPEGAFITTTKLSCRKVLKILGFFVRKYHD